MKKWLVLIATLSPIFFAFQNCARPDLEITAIETLNAASSTSEPAATPAPPLVCDPFAMSAPSSGCGGAGLQGKISYFDLDSVNKKALGKDSFEINCPSFPLCEGIKTRDFQKYGHPHEARIVLSQVNIKPQVFTEGFPIGNNQYLLDSNGNKLIEYFGLELVGFISNPTDLSKEQGNPFPLSNEIQLATVSDDGVIVDIDGDNVINHDSLHAPTWKCSKEKVTFTGAKEKKKIRLNYYQGPRQDIALQLFYRSADMASQPCDSTGGFIPVPVNALSY